MGFALAAGACSGDGTTYILYTAGAAGMPESGGSTSSGGSSSNAGSDPGSGGSDPGSGGGDPGSGGSDPGSGGAGNQSGSGNGGSGPQTPLTLIDDFADCDGNIIEIDGRKGAWYSLNALNVPSFGPPPTSGWIDQSCGAFITGLCPSCEVAGLALILAAGSYDLSPYSGISVTFESEASLYIAVKTTNGSSYGYLRSAAVLGAGTGGTRTVYFSSMTADVNFHGLSWAQEIHFTLDDFSKENGFGLGIHRVELIP